MSAGTFDTVSATCAQTITISATETGKTIQLGSNQEEITFWYAKGVGLVKSVAAGGSNNETVTLSQYKIK